MDVLRSPTLIEALAHERFVRSAARAVLGVDDRVEDVVQESLVEALRTGPRAVGALRAWLGTVARRRAIDVRRRDTTRRRAEDAAPPRLPAPPPDEILAREEVRRVLVGELLALEEPSREVLLLRFFEDLPPREIAARLGIPVETVRTRTRRAIERLRVRLDERTRSRRAWASALAGVAGLSIVPTAAGTVAGGAVWAAAGILVAAVSGGVWLAAGRGGHDTSSPSAVQVGTAGGGLAAPPARATSRPSLAAGEACGIVGYATANARPARAHVTARRVSEGVNPRWMAAVRSTDVPPDAAVETDARGRFVADGLAVGSYVLTATLPDGHAVFRDIVLADPGALVAVRLDLTRGHRALNVRVVESDGRPARGWVYVDLETADAWHGGTLPARLDETGTFVVHGLAGPLARAIGSFEGRTSEEFTSLSTGLGLHTWTLPPPRQSAAQPVQVGVIEGRVRSTEGRVVGGVRVFARVGTLGAGRLGAERNGEIAADAAGRFRFEGLGVGEATVWVLDAGWMSKGLADVRLGAFDPLAVATDARGFATVAVEVVPAATVRGRVLDEEGRGVARVVVYLEAADEDADARWDHPPIESRARTVTDVDGGFEITDAVPGRRYDLEVWGGDVAGSEVPSFTAPADLEVQVATLNPEAWVDVEVVDADTSAPLRGARVSLRRIYDGGSAPVGPSLHTGGDGLARVGPLPHGRADVEVYHPDQRETQEPVEVTEARLRVPLRTGPSIAGLVRYPAGVEPSHGTDFVVLGLDGTPVLSHGRVDRDGVFTTGALTPGRYRLRFKRDFPDPALEGEVEAETGARDLEVALAPVPAEAQDTSEASEPWRIHIRTADGSTVARGRLHVIQEQRRSSFGLNGDRFDLTITGSPISAVLLVTDAADAQGAAFPLAARILPLRTYGLEGGALEIVLSPERPIEGVVVDAEGRPLAGVVVTATPQRDSGPVLEVVGTARTDDAGRFRMPGTDDGVHRLHVDPPRGYLARDVVARGGDVAVRLALDATAAATLWVVDDAGRPVEGATLIVRPISRRHDPFDRDVAARGQSDASGHARLEGFDGAKPWQLEVHPPHGRADVFARTVSPWTVADGTVRLERTWTIKGRVVDLAGIPIGGASVTGGGASAEAESDGRFVLEPLSAGAVSIQTHLDWVHGPEVAAQAGDDVGDLRLDRAVPLRVRVEDWPGPPARRADVPVRLTGRRADGQRFGSHEARTTDGTFTMRGVPRDGRYRVYIGPWPDGRYALGEGLEGRDQPHLLQLVPGLEVRGRLLGSASDLERIQVELLDDTGSFLHVEPRDDGSFRVVGVPPGTYEILVMPEGQKSLRVHVEAGASPVDIPLPARR